MITEFPRRRVRYPLRLFAFGLSAWVLLLAVLGGGFWWAGRLRGCW